MRNLNRIGFLSKFSLQNWYFNWVSIHPCHQYNIFIIAKREETCIWSEGVEVLGKLVVMPLWCTIWSLTFFLFDHAYSTLQCFSQFLTLFLFLYFLFSLLSSTAPTEWSLKRRGIHSILQVPGFIFHNKPWTELSSKGTDHREASRIFGLWSIFMNMFMNSCFQILIEYPTSSWG